MNERKRRRCLNCGERITLYIWTKYNKKGKKIKMCSCPKCLVNTRYYKR